MVSFPFEMLRNGGDWRSEGKQHNKKTLFSWSRKGQTADDAIWKGEGRDFRADAVDAMQLKNKEQNN